MTVSLTYRTDGKGHALIVADGADVDGIGRRYVAVHRLVAVAHGALDGLSDEREVHHVDAVPCNNGPSNLQAVDSETHGRLTAEQVAERRAGA